MSTMQSIFSTSEPVPGIDLGQAHLYSVDLDEVQLPQPPEQVLSRDERKRADFYRIPLERRRYMMGRAVLRIVLGRYVERLPDDLKFEYGLHGKPKLSHLYNRDHLEFNVSRSAGQVLYAISRNGPVGVDIQRVEFPNQAMEIAQRVFLPEQVARLRTASASERSELFCNWWTRGEAVAKATGAGLSTMDDQRPQRWWVSSIYPARGFAGAIAFGRKPERVRWVSSEVLCVIKPHDEHVPEALQR